MILCVILLIPVIIIILNDQNNNESFFDPSKNFFFQSNQHLKISAVLLIVPFVGPIILMQLFAWVFAGGFRNRRRVNKLGTAIDDWNK